VGESDNAEGVFVYNEPNPPGVKGGGHGIRG
jgi:hypothetical protein